MSPMRIALIVIAALAALAFAGTLAVAVYARMVSMPAAVWHVDPAGVTPPRTPNYALRTGDDAPRLPGAPEDVAARFAAVAEAEGATLIGGSVEDLHMTYVQRSRIMGYPDAISLRFHAEGDATRIDVFSRARMGRSDFGVNAARVARWIDAAQAR